MEEAGLPAQVPKQEDLIAGDNENTSPRRPDGISIPPSLAPIHELRRPTQDGKTAEASYRMPPGEGPFPAIIFQHGGFGYQPHDRRHLQLTQGAVQTRFLAQGYVAVQTTRQNYEDNPQSQAPIFEYMAVVDAVKNLDQVDPKSVVVMGGSGGGSMTLDLISRTTVSAAVAGEPASIIFAGMLTKPAQDREVRYEAINDPEAFWTPDIIAKVQDKVSRYQTPLLILHGDIHPLKHINMDYIIPEIKKSNKTVKVNIYPGKNHEGLTGTAVRTTYTRGKCPPDDDNMHMTYIFKDKKAMSSVISMTDSTKPIGAKDETSIIMMWA